MWPSRQRPGVQVLLPDDLAVHDDAEFDAVAAITGGIVETDASVEKGVPVFKIELDVGGSVCEDTILVMFAGNVETGLPRLKLVRLVEMLVDGVVGEANGCRFRDEVAYVNEVETSGVGIGRSGDNTTDLVVLDDLGGRHHKEAG